MTFDSKYIGSFDPYSISIDELSSKVDELENLVGYYETKQLALKKFINSIYGATASKYFVAHNIDVAESITLQGQDLNHYSENCVNTYFKGIFQNDTELHKKLGIKTEDAKKVRIGGGKLTMTKPLIGPQYSYLNGDTESMTIAGDTDSVDKDSMIKTSLGDMRIEDLFTKLKYENNDIVLRVSDGSEVVPCTKKAETLTYSEKEDKILYRPINYIMRHKVSKARYKIKTKNGKEVIVTEDHSCMVMRDGKLVSVKANEINPKTDKVVSIV